MLSGFSGRGEFQIYVYDPSTQTVSKEILREFFDFIPAKIVQCRIFTLNHDHDAEIARAAEQVLGTESPSTPTNV